MIVLSWNCRELGNQCAVNVLSHLVREKAPNILFLMETKQTVEEMRWVQGELHYDSMLAISCLGRRGGLAMMWNNEVDLHIQTYTQNHIDAFIFKDRNSPWWITGFYAKPKKQLHHETWDLLKHLKSRSLAPWLCIGDYNKILASEEKEGGHHKPIRLMNNFKSTLLHCGLIDLGFTGNMFTWNNGRGADDFVQLRLDRACAIVEWRSLFPQVRVSHLQAYYSDHVSILLTTHLACHQVRPKKFPRDRKSTRLNSSH